MPATAHFSIKFDGPALTHHQMDVRELAPALIALSDLVDLANKAAFPDGAEVRVHVSGSFKGGSFGVDLIAIQSLTQQLVSLFGSQEASAASNLFGILGGLGLIGGGGLIRLIKWLHGRRPSSIRTVGDKVVFELREDGVSESMEVDLVTGRLYQTRTVRQALAKVVAPLGREGIDAFLCGAGDKLETVVREDDLPSFNLSASEADVVSDEIVPRVVLQVESAVFRDGNKWRLSDGSQSFHAEITDREFLDQVESGAERFGKGDILIVELRRIQTVTDGGLKMDSVVTKVLEHRAPLQQVIR